MGLIKIRQVALATVFQFFQKVGKKSREIAYSRISTTT